MINFNFHSVLFCFICLQLMQSCKETNNNLQENKTSTSAPEKTNSFDTKNDTSSGFDFLPTSTSKQIIVHNNFTLSYLEDYEQAEWVAYELVKGRYATQDFERPYFIEDPKVKTGSADWKNYRKSGYDKGHLCPAGDMKFSRAAFDETFFTSNISPQNREFNSGVWNRLEQKVRYWSNKYNGMYVVTGGVLEDGLETIGFEDVAVPEYFYKILVSKVKGQYKMIGFLMSNEDSQKALYEFVVSVDEIEQKTGIDFFPKLDDATENQLERSSNYKEWSF
jgi:endonuclease G, mitochondrial